MSQNNNSLYSCLIQLNHIGYRLSWANYNLEKIVPTIPDFVISGGEAEKETKKIEAQIRMYLDYIFLNLDQLLEIHNKQLGKMLKELNHLELERGLVDIWQPIKRLYPKVELWRNGYVAHSTDQAINYKSFIEIDPDYKNTIRNVFFVSQLAVLYIAAIFTNLKTEYKEALISQKQKLVQSKEEIVWSEFKEWWKTMKSDVETTHVRANIATKNKGYVEFSFLKYSGQ